MSAYTSGSEYSAAHPWTLVLWDMRDGRQQPVATRFFSHMSYARTAGKESGLPHTVSKMMKAGEW